VFLVVPDIEAVKIFTNIFNRLLCCLSWRWEQYVLRKCLYSPTRLKYNIIIQVKVKVKQSHYRP